MVYVTVSSAAEGERIARALVDERLAACVTRIAGARSTYRWQGQIEQSDEELLLAKTSRERFPSLARRVQELHSYEVPEVIAVPIAAGNDSYLQWLHEQVTVEGK